MANEVRFIHDALGQSTISNMATEATMKELLEAMGSGSTTKGGKGLGSLKGVFNGFERKVKSFEHGVKSTMRPFTGFISMIGKGEVRMSAFGNHLNNSVISKLPGVGKLFGGVGSVVFAGVGILESWNTASKSLAVDGATFGNSMLEFVNIAGKTRMSLSDLNSVVGQNIEKFNSLGPSTAQGVRNFSKFSDDFFSINQGASSQLLNMGMSFTDINTQMVDFLFYTQRTTNMSLETNAGVQKSFVSYVRNLDMLTKMFSMDKNQINQASSKILKNSMFMIDMNKKDSLTQNKHAMAAQMLSATYGESVAGVYMDQAFGTGMVAGKALDLQLMLKNGISPIAAQLVAGANDPNMSEEKFEELTMDVLAESIYNSKGQLGQMNNLLAMMSNNPQVHQGMYDSISTIADYISKKDLKNASLADIKQIMAEAKDEQKRIDGINAIIIAFNKAIQNFKSGFVDGLTGGLEQFGLSIADIDLPGKFNKAGELVADWAEKAAAGLETFFKHMSTESGRDYIKERIKIITSKYASRAKRLLVRAPAVATGAVSNSVLGTTITDGAVNASDYVKNKTGNFLDLPFFYTKQQFDQENATDDFFAAAMAGQAFRQKNFGLPSETIAEGTKFTPNYAGLGIDKNLGQLTYKNGKFMTSPEAALYEMKKQLNDPNTGWVTKLFLPKAISDLQTSIALSGQYLPDDISQTKLNQMAQLSNTGSSDTANVQLHNGQLVEVNAKYRGALQSMVDLLASLGINILRGQSVTDGIGLISEAHGTGWFNKLSEDDQFLVVNALRENNMSSYDVDTPKYTNSIQNLRNGIITGNTSSVQGLVTEGFRTGTLESTGRLFNDFGRRTKIQLSGDKAVLTKPQFDTIKEGAAQIPMKDLVNSVNSSVQEMIRLTQMDINTSKSTLSVA